MKDEGTLVLKDWIENQQFKTYIRELVKDELKKLGYIVKVKEFEMVGFSADNPNEVVFANKDKESRTFKVGDKVSLPSEEGR